jgi:hypothetical protein
MRLFVGFFFLAQFLFFGWCAVQMLLDVLRARRTLEEEPQLLTTYADFTLPVTLMLLLCCGACITVMEPLGLSPNYGILGVPAVFGVGAWRFADLAVWNPKSARSARVQKRREAVEIAPKPTPNTTETTVPPFGNASPIIAAPPSEKEVPVQTTSRHS